MNPRRDEAVSAEKVRGLRSAYHAQAQPLDPGNRPGPVARPQLRIRRLGISRLRSEPKRPGGGKREGRVTAVTSPPSPASGGVTQRHVPTIAAVRGQVVPGAVASAARSRERRAGAITSPEPCPPEAERCVPARSGPVREDQHEESAEVRESREKHRVGQGCGARSVRQG